MLKAIFYLSLMALALIATLRSPLAGAVACLLGYLVNPTVFNLPDGGFRYQLAVTAAFLISCALHRPRGPNPVAGENWVLKALWVFVALGALSSTWAVVSSQQALDAIYEVFKTVLMVSLMVRVIRDSRSMGIIMMACMVGVWHASILHIFGVRFGYVSAAFGRENGVLPDAQTSVLILFIPSMLVLGMLGTRSERLLAWAALPFALDSVVETYERTGLVALCFQLCLILLFLPRRIALRLTPVMAIGVALFLFRFTPEDYWTKMTTILAPHEEASANSRLVINDASWRMLQDYPMGVGYRNYLDVSPRYLGAQLLTGGRRSAHNSFFSVVCETGVFGFAVWVVAFGGTIWMLRGIRKRSNAAKPSRVAVYAMGLEIGLYGWLAGGWFQAYHEVDPAYWFVALAVALRRIQAQEQCTAMQDPGSGLECVSESNVDSDLSPKEAHARFAGALRLGLTAPSGTA